MGRPSSSNNSDAVIVPRVTRSAAKRAKEAQLLVSPPEIVVDDKRIELEDRLKNAKKELLDLKHQMGSKVTAIVKKKVEQKLVDERKLTSSYRARYLSLAHRQEIETRADISDPPAWKMCEICTEEFKNAEGKCPRVLRCGHTLCEGCILKLLRGGRQFHCPFCRKSMIITKKAVEGFPKNFSILGL